MTDIYEVYVGFSEWRGGDYTGSYAGSGKTFYFRSYEKASNFVSAVNNKHKLTHLQNAQAYTPQRLKLEDD